MKKIIAIAVSLLAFAAVASAQSRAIGARLGGDAELSYQYSLGNNFIEGDLGMSFGNYGGLRLTGIYDFSFDLPSNFGFYIGPGAQLGMYGGTDDNGKDVSTFGIGLGGQIGFEYHIQAVPLNISVDWRPMWDFIGSHATWSSAALGIRYAF